MGAWPAVEIVFPGPGAAGAPGVLSLQDRVMADLDGLDIVAIAEHPGETWQVFFRSEADRASALALLHATNGPGALGLRPIDVEDEDWARRSQASLLAVRVGRIAVAPPWDTGCLDGDPAVTTVVIEPAMGFGSGHHATTRLCLEALQRIDLRGCRVLDVGTGSGVLALAAALLGAADVVAIDIDRDALDNARGNAALNGSPLAVEFRQADFRHGAGLEADVVFANLTGATLVTGAPDLARAVAPGGALVLSGITVEERDAVYRAFTNGFSMEWHAEEEGWCCALLRAGGRSVASSKKTECEASA
ncbi:MAG: 50S ribosomal protein L11 methyltransferase [Vicinamibacterales bacterium]